AAGTLTAVSAYNSTQELLTGDAYDFRPAATSVNAALYGFDLTQSQFLKVRTVSQELRLTSPAVGRFSWIAGAYYVHTDRFISTGNMVDTGNGVLPVDRTPSANPLNPQVTPEGERIHPTAATFLADAQDNDAWAIFADATFALTPQLEFDGALRYDRDTRRNTTLTPEDFLPDAAASTGEVRSNRWSALQPKATLRYKPAEAVTLYSSWSRGFRSGGFNQTGVGAVADSNGVSGVNDLFDAEVADTFEIGAKGRTANRRFDGGISL